MCSRQNSLGKGGLNAKAKRREFIECDIRKSPFSKPCVFDVDDVTHQILKDLKDYIARCVECDFLPLIPDNDDYITSFIVAYQNVMNMLNALPTVELDVEEELGVLKDMPDGEAYYRNGYCTKCKAQMPTEVLHGKISQRSIKFCFNCGAKINGVLWTLIEEGIIKEK